MKHAFLLCAALLGLTAPASAAEPCARATVKTGFMPDGRVTVPVVLENHPLTLLLDTGGVSTTIKWDHARALGLGVKQSGRRLMGVAGSVLNFTVASENLSIGELRVRNHPIYVEARPLAVDGTLAADILRDYDIDLDFPRSTLTLIAPGNCDLREAGAAAVAIDIDQNGHARFPVRIDGKTINATLDTGSVVSLISMQTAAQLGIYPSSSQLSLLQDYGSYRLHTYPFELMEIGRVAVKNPRIVIAGDAFMQGLGSDLVLGMDALRDMHITIAYGAKRLYITAPN